MRNKIEKQISRHEKIPKLLLCVGWTGIMWGKGSNYYYLNEKKFQNDFIVTVECLNDNITSVDAFWKWKKKLKKQVPSRIYGRLVGWT